MKENIIYIGDTHGVSLLFNLLLQNININTTYIHVGDVGLGFSTIEKDKEVLKKINNLMILQDSELLMIRGNHDNPSYWHKNLNLSNVRLVKDYEVIDNHLFIGGAISVDRTLRIINKNYWEGENIIKKDISNLKDIEVIVAHSKTNYQPPFVFDNFIKEMSKVDKSLINELKNEQKYLTDVYRNISLNNNIKLWINGHFHKSESINYNNTKFVSLNINELYAFNTKTLQ